MLRRIVLATDFGEASEAALGYSLTLASTFQASVIVHHAIEPIEVGSDEDETLEAFYESLRTAAAERMGPIVARFAALGVDVKSSVTMGRRWSEILHTAEAERADLIVVGSRAPSFAPALVGTTSHKVFLASRLPVLVVRATTEGATSDPAPESARPPNPTVDDAG